jgi:hypothetical protein
VTLATTKKKKPKKERRLRRENDAKARPRFNAVKPENRVLMRADEFGLVLCSARAGR